MKHELTSKELTWTNIQSPTPEELAELVRESGLSASDAEFMAMKHHRPEITVQNDYILFLLHVPVFDRKLRVTVGVPIFFVVKENELYSLHYEPIIAMDRIRQDFEQNPEKQEEYFDDPLSLCLHLISLLYNSAFSKLEKLSKHIDIAEDAVFQGNEKKMVVEISVLSRDVMDFRKVIRPHTRLFASVPRHRFIDDDKAARWHRIHGQLLKIWEILESMFESVKELSGTNFTLLQHKENELLRLLTGYSIIVIPMLVLVDPLFNPNGPDATIVDSVVFWAVIAILVVTLIYILIRSRVKRLL